MLDRRFEFEKVFRILRVILRLLEIFAREFFYAVVAVPFRHCPEMTDVAVDPSPDLDAEISFDAFIIGDARVDQELQVLIGVLGLRASMPDSCDGWLFHLTGYW